MTGAKWSVALVMLNWNGRDDLLRALASLRSVADHAVACVVDNGSTDDSVTSVRAKVPECHLIETGSNLGFSAGNNLGIRWALDEGFDVVGLLNNDIIAGEGFLTPLVDALHIDPENTYLSPQIRYLDRPDTVWFGGAEIDECSGIYVHSPIAASTNGISASPVVTGCALFAHRSVWQRVGLLDETYFLIFEDTEWCTRANRLGCSGKVVHDSVIHHAVSSTINRQAPAVGTYYYTRNGVRFLRTSDLPHRRRPRHFAGQQIRSASRGFLQRPGRSTAATLRAAIHGAVDGFREIGGPR